MDVKGAIRRGRMRAAWWVKVFDLVRPVFSAEGRSRILTRAWHRSEVHQTTAYTEPDRYPELMALAAKLNPRPSRILSFGCSTGEELATLRCYFPKAQIVGAEINARSRRIAKSRIGADSGISVVAPEGVSGTFAMIFALAVFQREPHKVVNMGVEDLSRHYPFARFDRGVRSLVDCLDPGGLLCVMHAHYPVETASAFAELDAIANSPRMELPLFGADGQRLANPIASSIFRKRA